MFSLSLVLDFCDCMNASGKYEEDGVNAYYSEQEKGTVIPLCISNPSFVDAITCQKIKDAITPEAFYGERFEAWVCPANSKTFKKRVDD